MKFFTFPILLFVSFSSFPQNPFNYGKSKEVYFMSRVEMKKRGIEYIYTSSFPSNLKDMPDDAYLTIIDFSKPGEYRNGWYPYYGTAKKHLTLQQLNDSSAFMNGTFYELDEAGKLASSGMEGRGALCQNHYEHKDSLTIVENSCRYGKYSTISRIYYHKNGLPSYSVCCEREIFEEEIENTEDMSNVLYTDTTRYVYNKQWQVTAVKTTEGRKSIFDIATGFSVPNRTSYIGRSGFEVWIDKNIGYRPKVILFEIYRNAVLVFRYEDKKKKYYEGGEITLE